jgi:hypothetical protein
MVDLVLAVEEKHNIECPTLMFWVVVNVCGLWVGVRYGMMVYGGTRNRNRAMAGNPTHPAEATPIQSRLRGTE